MADRHMSSQKTHATPLTGIEKTTRWLCDVFTGTADALMHAGLVNASELEPQKGRPDGHTIFLPGGQPCPMRWRARSDPGYKDIRRIEDGTYRVEITVPKDVQAWRRKAEAAANHEVEQERVNKAPAESGDKYRNWSLKHSIGDEAESWEGTNAQLQAAGIGVGLRFPGEPGGPPSKLYCKCPLGFDVLIRLQAWCPVKAAAGIYLAQSRYVPFKDEPKEYVAYASGVLAQVPGRYDRRSDTYVGSAEALVDANLVPSIDLFPGQPGRNKGQASYRKDWSPVITSVSEEDRGATIRKRGKSQFTVEVPVSKP